MSAASSCYHGSNRLNESITQLKKCSTTIQQAEKEWLMAKRWKIPLPDCGFSKAAITSRKCFADLSLLESKCASSKSTQGRMKNGRRRLRLKLYKYFSRRACSGTPSGLRCGSKTFEFSLHPVQNRLPSHGLGHSFFALILWILSSNAPACSVVSWYFGSHLPAYEWL